jgi:hypothetical protein
VTVSPPSGAVLLGATQSFTATVSNTTNTGVTWAVNGIAGGNSSVGTIIFMGHAHGAERRGSRKAGSGLHTHHQQLHADDERAFERRARLELSLYGDVYERASRVMAVPNIFGT